MIIVDTNVLLYAVNNDSRQHDPAHRWLTNALGSTDTVGFCWAVLLGFVRISTHQAIMPNPLRVEDAFDVIDAWLDSSRAIVVEPTTRHRHILRGLLTQSGAAGNLTTDAHIAALAIDHGATVATFDRDFARFNVPVVVPA
jgi:toxin-antitoxin system PIN domain toxin